MKKIITALQNENVNKKLSENPNIEILINDIQYQEGILEFLEINPNINYIILSELLPGSFQISELIKKIRLINKEIKLIIILKEKNEELENLLLAKGNINIFYNNQITIEDIIKIINEQSEKEKIENELIEIKKMIEYKTNNEEEINSILTVREIEEVENEIENEFFKDKISNKIIQYINKNTNKEEGKIIAIIGLSGVGKTTFTINLANSFHHQKILIIEINSNIKDIQYLLNKKNKKTNHQIIKINTKIDLISDPYYLIQKNSLEVLKEIEKLKNEYNIILLDIEQKEKAKIDHIIKEIHKIIFLVEPNILQIKKSIYLLDEFIEANHIEKEKINIVFNKVMKDSISFNILKNILKDYNMIGKISFIKNFNTLINQNMKYVFLNKRAKNEYKKITKEIVKNSKLNRYYLNKIKEEK